MKEFFVYALKSGALLGVFLGIYQLFLRKTTFHEFKRLFLLTGILLSIVISFIHYRYEVIIPASVVPSVSTYSEIIQPEEKPDLWILLFAIYILGVFFIVGRNLYMVRNLYKLIQNSVKYDGWDCILVNNSSIKTPFTVYKYVLINLSNLSADEKEIIINHEKIHIYQKHWIDLLLSECMLAFQWFNPLAWIYVKMEKENHEFLADKAVIDMGTPVAMYQAVLINQRFGGPVFSFSNLFNYSNYLNRLIMMKKEKSSHWRKLAVLAILPATSLFIWASASPHYVLPKMETLQHNQVNPTSGEKPMYILDGKEISKEEFDKLNPSNIESIDVLKSDSGTEKYGKKGKHGVVIVESKKEGKENNPVSVSVHHQSEGDASDADNNSFGVFTAEENTEGKVNIREDDSLLITEEVLVYIDGEEASKEILNKISPDKIKSISVLKNKAETIEKYGDKGKNGVILIETNK